MIKKVGALALFLYAPISASVFVQTPKGSYVVEPSPGGFEVYDMNGNGITSVQRDGSGYSVISPQGVTNVYSDGRTSNPALNYNPIDGSSTPIIPNLGD